MFSKKTLVVVGLVVVVVANIIILSITSRRHHSSYGPGQLPIALIAPFQKAVTHTAQFLGDIWRHYFQLVSAAEENDTLKRALSRAVEKNNQCSETDLSNLRLRNLLDFQKTMTNKVLAAEVIGQDPSPWFKTVIIDKGKADGVEKGLPVVIPEGIAGQVMDVSGHYAKVLLMIDQSSAVDALIQRTRARGIIEGDTTSRCTFKYVLRKHDIQVGDTVVSSGLDGVFPKGLSIGRVAGVVKPNSGIFQEVTVTPFVDFEKLEEVLVVLNPKRHEFESGQ